LTEIVFEPGHAADKDAFIALTRLTHQEHSQRLPDEFPVAEDTEIEKIIIGHFASSGLSKLTMFTRIIAAKDGPAVIGYAVIFFYPHQRSPDSYDVNAAIYDISLLADYRNRGIGKLLLEHCEKVMREAGATAARANVWRDNPASTALFRADGWGDVNTTFARRLAKPLQGSAPKAKLPKTQLFCQAAPVVFSFIPAVIFLMTYALIVYLN
jgi:ribosomal protein S18 acetylase RimI-like enzyme